MMKNVSVLLFVLMCVDIFATSPGMIIRCNRSISPTIVSNAISCPSGFELISGVCLPLAEQGSCPDGFVTREIDDGEGTVIVVCVPNCSLVSACGEIACNDDSIVEWDILRQGCGCETTDGETDFEFFNFCGCPFPLTAQEGQCDLESEDCFEGDVEFNLGPIICDEPISTSTLITIVVTGPGGSALTSPIRVADLENCVFTEANNNNALLTLSDIYMADFALIPINDPMDPNNGFVVLDLNIEDLSDDAQVSLGFDDDLTIIDIPSCPTFDALDPCSCDNPNNVLSDDGNSVLFWEDELTIVGSPGATVTLTNNINAEGFLMPIPSSTSAIPFPNGVLGTIPPTGILTIQFYKDATDSETNIEFTVGAAMDTFNETCGLAPTACTINTIPTIGEWALLILSLLLLLIGIVSFRAKKSTRSILE